MARSHSGAAAGEGVQRRPQGLAQQLQAVQVAHRGEHVRAVRALPASGLEQPALAGCVQQAREQALGGPMPEQPAPELAQDGEVEPWVG